MSVLDDVYGSPTSNPLDEVYGEPEPKRSFAGQAFKQIKKLPGLNVPTFTQEELEKDTWGGEIQRALVRGGRQVKGTLPGTTAWWYRKGGKLPLPGLNIPAFLPWEVREEKAEELEEAAARTYESIADPEIAPKKGGVRGYIVNTVAEIIPTAVAAIGASAVAGPVGAFVVGGALESEAHYQEAIRSGATQEQADAERLLVFIINGALEQMQADEVLKLSKAGYKPIIDAAKKKAWKKLGKEAGKLTAKHIAGAASESLEETLQEATSIGAASLHGEKIATWENLKRLGGAALAGAVGYGGLGAAGASVRTGMKGLTRTEAELQATLDKGVEPELRQPVLQTFVDPIEVQTEMKEKYDLADPDPTVEKARTEDVLDTYWGERDERDFEVNTVVAVLQQKIARMLGKERYSPETDQETADASLAIMLYIDSKQYPEHKQFLDQLTDEQKRLYNRSQHLPPGLQEIADQIIALEQQSGQFGLEQGVLHNVLENHISHIWKTEKQKGGLFSKFRTRTKLAKQRTLNTGGILEGWARGMELEVSDVTAAMQIAMKNVSEAVAGKHLIRVGKDNGVVATRRKAGEDWVELQALPFSDWQYAGEVDIDPDAPLKPGTMVRAADRQNLGKVVKVSEDGKTASVHFRNKQEGTEATVQLNTGDLKPVRSYGENFFVGEDGKLMERVKLYAAPKLAKKLNNITEQSWVRKTQGFKQALEINARLKHVILSTSLFHHQAFIRSYALGSRGIDPRRGYEIGKNAIMNLDPQARLLVRNGLTLGRIQDYDPRFIHGRKTIWGRALSLTRPGEKVYNAIIDLRNRNEQFLFNQLGPYLKMASAILELQAEVKQNQAKLESGEVTMDQLAKRVADLMNNDFGGLHLGRKGRSNTIQDLFRMVCLAPDWTESNIMSVVKAFRRGDEGKLYRAFWGRIAMKGIGATVAFNLLMAAFDDDDFWERYKKAWEAGDLRWLEVDITPIARLFPGTEPETRKYFNLIGHFKDPVKFTAHPIRSAKHKGSIIERIVHDALEGEDWAGRSFTSVGELTGITDPDKRGEIVKWEFGGGGGVKFETAPSYLAYEARSTLPLQAQNALAFVGGEMDSFDMLTKSLGMATATHTPTEVKQRDRKRRRRRRSRKRR